MTAPVTDWYEPATLVSRAMDARRSWYCVSWPDGSCLHLHSMSATTALAWTRAENGAPPVKGKHVNADICSRTLQSLPILR